MGEEKQRQSETEMASRDDEEEEEEEEEVVEETTATEKKEKKKSTSIRGVKPTDAPMMFMGGYEEISMAMVEEKSKALFAETDIPKTKVPICEICTGFLVSLPCGHDGCVRCLQKASSQFLNLILSPLSEIRYLFLEMKEKNSCLKKSDLFIYLFLLGGDLFVTVMYIHSSI